MKLQYVFGNPTKSKTKRSGGVKRKSRKRNPERYKVTAYTKKKKGKKRKKVATKTTRAVLTRSELAGLKASLAKLRAKKARLQDLKLGKSKAQKNKLEAEKKKVSHLIKTLTTAIKKKQKVRASTKKLATQMAKDIKSSGDYTAKTSTERKLVRKKRKKKSSTRRKKASKKKSTRRKKKTTAKKKKTTRRKKRKSSTKKRRKKAKKTTTKKRRRRKAKKSTTKRRRRKTTAKKRKSTRRKRRTSSKKRKTSSRKKMKKVASKRYKKPRKFTKLAVYTNPRKRSNPMKVAGMKVAGYDTMELAELGAGGLLYGVANSYLSPLFAKIPGLGQFSGMLGGTIPSLVAGVALNIVSDKVKQKQIKDAASFLGDGLLGAAVVGAGVSLSQTLLPQAAMAGVDYYPGLSSQGKDFGGVDYTPELMGNEDFGGVDYTSGRSLPGQSPDADFGEYEQSASDFGEIPDGMN